MGIEDVINIPLNIDDIFYDIFYNLSCNCLLVVEYLGCCDQETIEERLFP